MTFSGNVDNGIRNKCLNLDDVLTSRGTLNSDPQSQRALIIEQRNLQHYVLLLPIYNICIYVRHNMWENYVLPTYCLIKPRTALCKSDEYLAVALLFQLICLCQGAGVCRIHSVRLIYKRVLKFSLFIHSYFFNKNI